MAVLDHLNYGKSNAVTLEKLIKVTGHSKRVVQKEIERLRNDNVVILTDSISGGFWLADKNDDDIEEQLQRYIHRGTKYIINRRKTIAGAVKLLEDIQQNNQLRLE